MIAKIEADLDEPYQERRFKEALCAQSMRLAIMDVDDYLRNAIKYGDMESVELSNKDIELLEKVRAHLHDSVYIRDLQWIWDGE